MNKMFTLSIIIISSLSAPLALGGSVEEFGRAVFSEVERRLIRDYYHERYGSVDRDRHYRDRDDERERDDYGGRAKKHKKKKGKGKHYSGPGNPKGLPPGIAKKLARGGTLPPGIAKKNLPADLDSRLPPVRDGYERMEVDGRVVLVDIASDTIVDIIRRTEILEAGTRNGGADREQRVRSGERPDDSRNDDWDDGWDDDNDGPKSEQPMAQEEEVPWYKFWSD